VKYAEIIRLNPPDYHPSVESFDLRAALEKPESAPKLKPLDTVRIFSRFDFENPPLVTVLGEVRSPGTYLTAGVVHLRDAVQLAGGTTPDTQLDSAQVFRYENNSKLKIFSVNLTEALAGDPLHNVILQPRDRVVLHRNPAKADPASVYIRGEVSKPGKYPLTTNLRVGDLIRLAGGLKRSAYTEQADLTRYNIGNGKSQPADHVEVNIASALAGEGANDLALQDGDTLTIRQLPAWNDLGATITLRGELLHPGVYGIRPGERLSSVLKRAGGFLATAYPRGTIFTREDLREFQEKTRQDMIQRIEQDASNVKVSLTESAAETAALQQAALQQRQRAVEALRRAPVQGRLVVNVTTDLTKFEDSPADIELRAGDTLTVPKRPDFVLVTGQVYNSNAITFTPRKSAGWYLHRAGGPTKLAEKDGIFIVRSNGAVVSNNDGGWWGGSVLSTTIEPGDTIVVPEKAIGPSTFWKNFASVAQVFSAAALGISVALR
jgi:protein involved in polysaccharide export with SLBB domain